MIFAKFFFQKFNLSAGARGAKIREGLQGPSYTTDNVVASNYDF